MRIEFNKTILTAAEYITNRKNLKIKSIDLGLKDKCIACFPELLSGIISPCSYVSIKTMSIISSDTKITKKNCVLSEKKWFYQVSWNMFVD